MNQNMIDKEEERKRDGEKNYFTFCVLHLKTLSINQTTSV